jgi:hypothetical protein
LKVCTAATCLSRATFPRRRDCAVTAAPFTHGLPHIARHIIKSILICRFLS